MNLTAKTILKNKFKKQALEYTAPGYDLKLKLSWMHFLIFSVLMSSPMSFIQLTSVLGVFT